MRLATNPKQLRRIVSTFAVLSFFIMPVVTQAADAPDISDYREALKTPAAKLAASGKYDEATNLTKSELEKNPQGWGYHRLLANLLRRQGRFQESADALLKWLKRQPADAVASIYLAEAQLQTSGAADAQKTLQGVLSAAPNSVVSDAAASMLAQINAGTPVTPVEPPVTAIPSKEFTELAPSKLFKSKNFADAAGGFEELSQRYPNESIVLRYWATSLAEAGRAEDSIPVFERAARIDPLGIALHKDWGAALKKLNRKGDAKKHLDYVKTYDPTGGFKKKAEKKDEKKKKSPFKITGGFGYTYDANYKKRSNVASQRKSADIDAGTWHYKLGGTYTLYNKEDWTVKADASLRHQYMDSSLDEKNKLIHNLGFSVGRKTSLFGKPVDIVMRNGGTHNAKHGVYNGLGYKNTVKLEWDWTDHYKPTVTNNISYSEKDDTGTRPEFTNKEGWSEEIALDHKLLPDPKNKDLYYTLGTAYRHDFALGANNVLDKVSFDAGIAFPIIEKLTGEVTGTYAISQYPKFSFPNSVTQKEGNDWTLKSSFVREINEHWEIEFVYSYLNFNNRNDRSQYDDHIYALSGNFKY